MKPHYAKKFINAYADHSGVELLKRSVEFILLRQIVSRVDAYYDLARRFHRSVNTFDVDEYQSPCYPLTTINVDPNNISQISFRDADKYDFGSVVGGDWDKSIPEQRDKRKYPTNKFKDYHIYRSFRQHFCHGLEWTETDFYQIAIDELYEKKSYWHGCKSREDLIKRFSHMDELYEQIRQKGYKSQKEIENYGLLRSLRNEITIDIGRDGELLFQDGRHRLSIVKILGLSEIPVVIRTRHREWMERRDEIYISGLPEKREELRDHPDLKYIV